MLLATSFSITSCVNSGIRVADRILKHGMYPELPQKASIEIAEWDHNWINSLGMVPTAHLKFSAPTSVVAAWISSIQTNRNESTGSPHILRRHESFDAAEGVIEIELLMSKK